MLRFAVFVGGGVFASGFFLRRLWEELCVNFSYLVF